MLADIDDPTSFSHPTFFCSCSSSGGVENTISVLWRQRSIPCTHLRFVRFVLLLIPSECFAPFGRPLPLGLKQLLAACWVQVDSRFPLSRLLARVSSEKLRVFRIVGHPLPMPSDVGRAGFLPVVRVFNVIVAFALEAPMPFLPACRRARLRRYAWFMRDRLAADWASTNVGIHARVLDG